MKRDYMDPTTWTEQDREFIDTARRLDDEQLTFLIELMTNMETGDSARKTLVQRFVEEQTDNYHLNTVAGRAAFMQAIRAI